MAKVLSTPMRLERTIFGGLETENQRLTIRPQGHRLCRSWWFVRYEGFSVYSIDVTGGKT
jgi:sensor c-di-GMP phosphodiesterase-like protein